MSNRIDMPTNFNTDKPPENIAYYRILCREGKYLVACMQWFDECDYDQSEYLSNKNDEPMWWDNEEDAIEMVKFLKKDYRRVKF